MGFSVMLWGAEKLVPAEYWCPYGTFVFIYLSSQHSQRSVFSLEHGAFFFISPTFLIVSNYCLYLKTLFNIVEAPLKKLLNFDVCVAWWCSTGPINSQEYKSFEIYALPVSFKISMTEYHHWLIIYSNTAVYGEKLVWYFWSLA